MKNINRLVWASGFTNDKYAHQNLEAYKKKCSKCNKTIWLKPDSNGWKAYSEDGSEHKCKKLKKKGKEPRHYTKDCKFCGMKLVMILMGKKKWTAFDENKVKHRCKGK